jgi:type I restriction enzyme, S subunit
MAGELTYTPLGELCDSERGITYGIVKVGDFVPGGVPVVRGGDIRNGRIVFDNEKRVTEEVSRQFQRTILKGGEILINLIAEPGHTAVVPLELVGANVSRDVGVIPLNDTVDHRYVDYCLKSPMAVQWLTSRLQGSVTQKINLGTLRDLPIPTPPLEKQRAIAQILGTLDDKIELNRQKNQTLEAIAAALFKSWFVDFDPVRAKAEGRDPGLSTLLAAEFPGALGVRSRCEVGWIVPESVWLVSPGIADVFVGREAS